MKYENDSSTRILHKPGQRCVARCREPHVAVLRQKCLARDTALKRGRCDVGRAYDTRLEPVGPAFERGGANRQLRYGGRRARHVAPSVPGPREDTAIFLGRGTLTTKSRHRPDRSTL